MLFNLNKTNHRVFLELEEIEQGVTDYTSAEEDAESAAGTDNTEEGEQTVPAEDNTNPEEAPEDYTVPDENEEGANTQQQDEEESQSDNQSEEDTEASGMDSDENEGNSSNVSDTDEYSSDTETSDDSDDNEIKNLQDQILSSLSPEQISIKDAELRQRYLKMYNNITNMIEKINDINKTEDSIRIFKFVSNKLDELMVMLDAYISHTYDTKTYVENEINFLTFLEIIRGTDKVLAGYVNGLHNHKKSPPPQIKESTILNIFNEDHEKFKDIDIDMGDGKETLSLPSGNAFESLGRTHQEYFNEQRLMAIESSKNIVESFNMFLNEISSNLDSWERKVLKSYNIEINNDGDIEKVIDDMSKKDPNLTQNIFFSIEKESNVFIANQLAVLRQTLPAEVSDNEIIELFKQRYIPESLTEEGCKALLKVRISLNRMYVNSLKNMLKMNYAILGLTEAEAKTLIDDLNKGDSNEQKAKAAIKAIMQDDSVIEKFKIKNQVYDFRSIGGGLFLPSADPDIWHGAHPSKILNYIFKYDVVVGGHGSNMVPKYIFPNKSKNTDPENQEKELSQFKRLANQLDSNYMSNNFIYTSNCCLLDKETFSKRPVSHMSSMLVDTLEDDPDMYRWIKNNGGNIDVLDRIENATDHDSLLSIIKRYKIDEYFLKINKLMEFIAQIKDAALNHDKSFSKDESDFDDIKSIINKKDKVLKYIEDIDINIYKRLYGLVKDIYDSLDKIDFFVPTYAWGIQSINTLNADGFEDVVELLDQLKKEGFKSVYLISCNPGHIDLPDRIKDDPNFKVIYGMNSVIKEDYEDDEVLHRLTMLEESLEQSPYYNPIYESYTIEGLFTEYESMVLNEGIIDVLKALGAKAIEIIIAIWKKIIQFFKFIWKKIKEFFVGKPTESKTKTELKEKIEVSTIEIQGNNAKVTTKKCGSMEEAQKQVLQACNTISKKIEDLSNKETKIVERINNDIKNGKIKPSDKKEDK